METPLILTATGVMSAFRIFQFLMTPRVGFTSDTSKGKVKRMPSTSTVASTICVCASESGFLSTTSSTRISELAEAMTSSVRKTRSLLGIPGSTISVAALALPCAR